MSESHQWAKNLCWQEIVDSEQYYFRCKWHLEKTQVARIDTIHTSLTSALHCNGNTARNWKEEAGCEAKETPIPGVWVLSQKSKVVGALSIDYVNKSLPLSVAEVSSAHKHQAGKSGCSEKLIQFLSEIE